MILHRPSAIFVISWVLCLLTMGGHLYSPDEEVMFRVTQSIATRARLDVQPIIAPDGSTFATRKGTNGLEYAQYGVGNSLAGVPFYWLGALASKVISDDATRIILKPLTQSASPDPPGLGHDLLKRFFVSLTGGLIASLTAVVIFLFCRKLSHSSEHELEGHAPPAWSDAVSGITALAYVAGTMALPHARTFFSEPLAGLLLLTCTYLLATPVARLLTVQRAALAGAALAGAFFTRLDTLFAAPGIGLLLLYRMPAPANLTASHLIQWLKIRLRRSNAIIIGAFAAPCILFFCWQLSMNALHFGHPFSSAYADQSEGIHFSTPILAGLYGFLFSVGKSIFLFSPAIILGLLGWPALRQRHPHLGIALAVIIVGKLLVHSTWQNWAGGWCWGPRHIFIIHAFLMIPAAAFIGGGGLPRQLFIKATLLVAFLVQLYACSQNFIEYYQLYFRNPYGPLRATVMYGPDDMALGYIKAEAIGPDGKAVAFPIQAMPAPFNDSIYVPQNSQWYRYAEMWNHGYTDNFWLNLLKDSLKKEQTNP